MGIERLGRDRFDDVVATLCAAFRDYPVMRYILGDPDAGYDDRLTRLVGYFTASRFERGYPVLGVPDPAGPRLLAAANVTPPRRVPAPPALEERYAALRAAIGDAAIDRFHRFAAATDALEPPGLHYDLGMIGVRPDAQGAGHGRAIIEAVHELSAADPDSDGVCLTTEVESNVRLYEHFGYRVLGRAVTDDGGLVSWTMFRDDP